MIRHLVWLDDALDPITDALLAVSVADDDILSATLTRERGALPAVEIEMAHPGWHILSPGQRRGVALVLSEDGTMATATVRARGWLRAMPSALTGETLTLQIECSPEDYEDLRDAAAQAVLDADAARPGVWKDTGLSATDPSIQGGTGRDTLFGRSEHLIDDVLAARTAWVRHDPVTHAVTIVDDAVSARILNVGDGYDPASLQVTEGEGAVEQVKWTVYATVDESVQGVCDIASRIQRQTSLLGYQVSGNTDMTANVGWSLSDPKLDQINTYTLPQPTGRVWRATYRQIYYVQTPIYNAGQQVGTQVDTHYGPTYYRDHVENKPRKIQYTYFRTWLANFNCSQSRREKFELVLDIPCQRVGGIKRVLDMGETTLGDLYVPDLGDTDAEIAYEGDQARSFEAGDFQILGGRVYRAVRATSAPVFVTSFNRRFVASTLQSEDWEDTGIDAALPHRSAQSYGDTSRGKATMAHALLRMRKAGLARMTGWSVTLTCDRADLPDVELEDHILFSLPARWDQPAKEATGRVTRIVEIWSGEEGDTVEVTLAVSVGTGVDGLAQVATMDRYGGGGYFGATSGYLQRPTGHLTAGDDVEFSVDADPLQGHFDGRRLADPGYSMLSATYQGSADEQLADLLIAAKQGKELTEEVTRPTRIDIRMRPLLTERLIERTFRIQASLLRSPRGIDLSEAA